MDNKHSTPSRSCGMGPDARRELLRALAEEDSEQCSYCGNSTPERFKCPECGREACYECAPTGPLEVCPGCREKEEA